MKFKGLNDWIEIFRGGKQVDSEGREHDGDALIDKAMANFSPGKHEPPIVIGHPADDAPAYGWVEGLTVTMRDGVKTLMAKFKQVVPEFAAAVEQGLFKKRSAAFYQDGSLRHVGFLGAAPPAVKGLQDIGFREKGITFEFTSADAEAQAARAREYGIGESQTIQTQGGIKMFKNKIKQFLTFIGIDASKVPDDALPNDIPDNLRGKTFSEADLEAAKTQAAKQAKETAEAAFAETRKTEAKAQRKAVIAKWVEDGVKDGKILPAWKDAGLAAFMERQDADEAFQFSEGETGKKTNLKWMQDFLEGFQKLPLFAEFASKNRAGGQQTDDQKQVEAGKRIAAHVTPKKD